MIIRSRMIARICPFGFFANRYRAAKPLQIGEAIGEAGFPHPALRAGRTPLRERRSRPRTQPPPQAHRPPGRRIFSRLAPPKTPLIERCFDGGVSLIPATGRLDFLSISNPRDVLTPSSRDGPGETFVVEERGGGRGCARSGRPRG